MINVDKRVRPQTLLQLLASNHLTSMLEQDGQNLERLACEFDS
jgi:hypothetical protein